MKWGELINELEGYGFKDSQGHDLQRAVYWNVIKDSYIDVWDEEVPEEFIENHTGVSKPGEGE